MKTTLHALALVGLAALAPAALAQSNPCPESASACKATKTELATACATPEASRAIPIGTKLAVMLDNGYLAGLVVDGQRYEGAATAEIAEKLVRESVATKIASHCQDSAKNPALLAENVEKHLAKGVCVPKELARLVDSGRIQGVVIGSQTLEGQPARDALAKLGKNPEFMAACLARFEAELATAKTGDCSKPCDSAAALASNEKKSCSSGAALATAGGSCSKAGAELASATDGAKDCSKPCDDAAALASGEKKSCSSGATLASAGGSCSKAGAELASATDGAKDCSKPCGDAAALASGEKKSCSSGATLASAGGSCSKAGAELASATDGAKKDCSTPCVAKGAALASATDGAAACKDGAALASAGEQGACSSKASISACAQLASLFQPERVAGVVVGGKAYLGHKAMCKVGGLVEEQCAATIKANCAESAKCEATLASNVEKKLAGGTCVKSELSALLAAGRIDSLIVAEESVSGEQALAALTEITSCPKFQAECSERAAKQTAHASLATSRPSFDVQLCALVDNARLKGVTVDGKTYMGCEAAGLVTKLVREHVGATIAEHCEASRACEKTLASNVDKALASSTCAGQELASLLSSGRIESILVGDSALKGSDATAALEKMMTCETFQARCSELASAAAKANGSCAEKAELQ